MTTWECVGHDPHCTAESPIANHTGCTSARASPCALRANTVV